jgi:phosphosulfolactate phosphohydrolase-like enzyme
MHERRMVAIDSVSESPVRHPDCDAVVLVDVICDTTTLVTAVAQERPVFPAASAPAAQYMARGFHEPILAADETETWRPGFEMGNSPSALHARSDRRPLVLVCGTGAVLAENARSWPEVYIACFRNMAATVRHLALRHKRVLILDAAHDDDIRCEDQMAAGRIALDLAGAGFTVEGLGTREVLERWGCADLGLVALGRSAEQLRRRRREGDLQFVLSHVDDLDVVCAYSDGRLSVAVSEEPVRELSGIA